MNIIRSYPENLTNRQKYDLCMSPNTQKMSDQKGQRLEFSAYALYEDVDKKTGEVKEILTLQTPEGETYGTNSATFRSDFFSMVDLFGEEFRALEIIGGTSKNGRPFITCAYSD